MHIFSTIAKLKGADCIVTQRIFAHSIITPAKTSVKIMGFIIIFYCLTGMLVNTCLARVCAHVPLGV